MVGRSRKFGRWWQNFLSGRLTCSAVTSDVQSCQEEPGRSVVPFFVRKYAIWGVDDLCEQLMFLLPILSVVTREKTVKWRFSHAPSNQRPCYIPHPRDSSSSSAEGIHSFFWRTFRGSARCSIERQSSTPETETRRQ